MYTCTRIGLATLYGQILVCSFVILALELVHVFHYNSEHRYYTLTFWTEYI